MLPLIYVGVFSFISSFAISHHITTEYLNLNYYSESTNYEVLPNTNKKNSKVKFSNEVRFKCIPKVQDMSTNTLSELWYTKDNYKEFLLDYKKYKSKYKSI